MAQSKFETALSAEGWTRQEMDDLRAMIGEVVALGQIHLTAKTTLSNAISRWNGGVSAKVASLGAGFDIPNPTDLAGTGDLSKENLTANLMSYVTTVQALGSQAHLDNILPLVGSENVS